MNAGALLLNLATPRGRSIIEKWDAAFHALVGLERLSAADQPWPPGLPDDQNLLHGVLAAEDSESILEKAPFSLIGATTSTFVRQVLRQVGSLEQRCQLAYHDVADVLGQDGDGPSEFAYWARALPSPLMTSPSVPSCEVAARTNHANLTALADEYGSDKGTRRGPGHRYTFLYDLILYPLKDRPITLLELGLAVGGPELGNPAERAAESPSVKMWLDYFSEANVVGFDITDFSHMSHPRFCFVQGDCGSELDLLRLAGTAAAFDVVIDDASHASFHQQLAFKVLFPKLTPGGIYIIEDLHWQSPFFEDQLPSVTRRLVSFLTPFLVVESTYQTTCSAKLIWRQSYLQRIHMQPFPTLIGEVLSSSSS